MFLFLIPTSLQNVKSSCFDHMGAATRSEVLQVYTYCDAHVDSMHVHLLATCNMYMNAVGTIVFMQVWL